MATPLSSRLSSVLLKADLYQHQEPLLEWRSTKSGVLSLVSLGILFYVTISAFVTLAVGNPSQVNDIVKATSTMAYTVPDLAINPSYGIREAPYSFNLSWYRFNFREVTRCKTPACLQENGGSTKKSKLDLGGRECDVVTAEGADPQRFWCPDEQGRMSVQGRFEDEIFKYVEVALEPCWVYESSLPTGTACANRTEIERLFCVQRNNCNEGIYSTLSMYLKNRQSKNLEEWESPLYVNIEPLTWLGIEIIARAVEAREQNIWGTEISPMHWLKYGSWYTRRAPAGGDKDDEILKFYIKTDGVLEKQHLTQFGFAQVGERIGSMWALLGITIGLLGSRLNAYKASHNKESRERHMSKRASEIDLTPPETRNRLQTLEENGLTVQLGIAKLRKPHLSYLWSMPVVRHVRRGGQGAEPRGRDEAQQVYQERLLSNSVHGSGSPFTPKYVCPRCLIGNYLMPGDRLQCSLCGYQDPAHVVVGVQPSSGESKGNSKMERAVSIMVEERHDNDGHVFTHDEYFQHVADATEEKWLAMEIYGTRETFVARTEPHEIVLRSLSTVSSEADTTDILISFDMTGSMSRAAACVRENVEAIVDRLFAAGPGIRIAVVVHGDYGDEQSGYYPGGNAGGPHVLKSLDFSRSKTAIKSFLDQCQQTGGGTFEECYELVLRHAQDLSWHGFNRAVLLIGDAIPHDANYYSENDLSNLDWRSELQILTDIYNVTVHGLRFESRSDASIKENNEKQTARFWNDLTQQGGGELFHQQYTPENADTDFAPTKALFEAFCLAYAGSDQLEDFIENVQAEAGSKGEQVSETKKRWFKQLRRMLAVGVTAVAAGAAGKAISNAH